MPLLDVALLARLREEFRLSMKRLLGDLCLDLENQYADIAKSWRCLWPTSGSLGRRSNGMPMPTGKPWAGSNR